MKQFLSLALVLTLLLCPALAAESDAAASDWTGPFSQEAVPTVLDTGRGYLLYYWYVSDIYYSEDGVTWTDLSDRQWVKDAERYTYGYVGGLGRREFEVLWTGTEYMMRQSLCDDPRGTHRRQGDSPRNNSVTFLDEDFQIIGERTFQSPVTAIRYEDGLYYATVGGEEVSFLRSDPSSKVSGAFSDVPADAWFAQGAALCAEQGLMVGTGEGQFSPDATLTQEECAVLALRLYDLSHGGDGVFEKAPRDWGYATFTFPDGQVRGGVWEDSASWDWARFSLADPGHLAFRLETEAEQAWGRSMDYQRAVFSMNGVDCPGELHLNGSTLLYFEPDPGEAWDTFYTFRIQRYPTSDFWYRDAWYYADQHDLQNLTSCGSDRGRFADAIFAVTGELDPINDIFALPDTSEHSVLSLCRAGVLTGTDPYGTFRPDDTLTRAEAATILARVLKPELRQSYSILPLETYENYTLTELYRTEDTYPILGERVAAVTTSEHPEAYDKGALLFLDGSVVLPPEGWGIERVGANDVCIAQDETAAYGVMDFQGQVTPAEWWEARERPGELSLNDYCELSNGYRSDFRWSCFENAQGQQVTPMFTWTGIVTPEGQSFVCLEGTVYRIEFAQ